MLGIAFSNLTRVFGAFQSGREKTVSSPGGKGSSRGAVALDLTDCPSGQKKRVLKFRHLPCQAYIYLFFAASFGHSNQNASRTTIISICFRRSPHIICVIHYYGVFVVGFFKLLKQATAKANSRQPYPQGRNPAMMLYSDP